MAHQGEHLKVVGLQAGADLSAAQFRFVKAGATAGQVVQASIAGEKVIGVLQNKPAAIGREAEIVALGETKVVAGAAFAYGVELMPDNQGRAVLATATNYSGGIALEAAGAAGELVTILLNGSKINS